MKTLTSAISIFAALTSVASTSTFDFYANPVGTQDFYPLFMDNDLYFSFDEITPGSSLQWKSFLGNTVQLVSNKMLYLNVFNNTLRFNSNDDSSFVSPHGIPTIAVEDQVYNQVEYQHEGFSHVTEFCAITAPSGKEFNLYVPPTGQACSDLHMTFPVNLYTNYSFIN